MGSFLEGVDQQTEVFAFVFIVLTAYMYIKCDSPSSPPPLLSARACSALRRLDCEAHRPPRSSCPLAEVRVLRRRRVASYQSANIRSQAANFPTGPKDE
jgi:hypothetical protein